MEAQLYRGRRVALLVPCYNEEAAIAEVISGFNQSLPGQLLRLYH